jgi:cell division protein FtsW
MTTTARARPTQVRPAFSVAAGIITVVAALNVVGLVMILSSSSVAGIRGYGSAWYFVAKQALWASLGATALVAGWRIDHHVWRRRRFVLLTGTVALLVVVLLPGVGTRVYGATRWITIGPISIQPSEIAKFTLGVFAADILAARHRRLADWRIGLAPVGLATGVVVLLVMLQPDMGTSTCILLVVGGIVIVSGVPTRHLARAVLGVAAVGAMLAWAEPYRRDRLLSFRHPFEQYHGDGYQLAQSLVGLGSGGPTGVGLGQSRAKWGFLPNAHTDFIYAIIGEEGGLAGTLFVLGLFVVLAGLGVRTARRAPDRFGALLAAGITTWLVGQALINIGAVIGSLPVTGVPLPFVSFGGSALLISMFAAGVLANIAATGAAAAPPPSRRPATRRPPTGLRAEVAAARGRHPAGMAAAAAAASPYRPLFSRTPDTRPARTRRPQE